MKHVHVLTALLCCLLWSGLQAKPAVRTEQLLKEGWRFTRQDDASFSGISDDSGWQQVTVPHDWAIYGPFGSDNDAQVVAITQNFERQASLKTGRTGGLPYVGTGWYHLVFDVDKFSSEKKVTLQFDGAMSEAHVYVNGKDAGYWPYGYNSFYLDVTDYIHPDGKNNLLAVRLENFDQSSRWYPGAGLYRNVHLIVTEKTHVPVWGTHITTPEVSEQQASVRLVTQIEGSTAGLRLNTLIVNPKGKVVARSDQFSPSTDGYVQQFTVTQPQLWSPESPSLYYAVTEVYAQDKLVDKYTTRFGIRSIELIADKGFFLNGKMRKFQGVCNHHDLGPLGAAINVAALRRQLTLLRQMGCDAIRTSHNMPAPELVELCDEMGFMMMVEPFDEWDIAKCRNGYHRFFKEWAEKDMVNMLRHFRNNPAVVMWSIGNEVPSQCNESGYATATFLRDICKREDPTRPVTCGMDQVACVLRNGLASLLDVPGFNYRVHLYQDAYNQLSHKIVLGSETASTVSSRGVYKFPIRNAAGVRYPDQQCSSYDLEYCSWSNLPDLDFSVQEDYPWTIGQFVWTGFDYLGEPTPYDGSWPNHSSMFGIIDLASIPKDRYYLYQSQWRKDIETLHILPHWNWEGREGEVTPVFVYTNYPSAELFINGKSQGRQEKNNTTLQNRYRLMWNDVKYEPGEVKVIAYDAAGKPVKEAVVRTAGAPHHIELSVDRNTLKADGEDLAYVNVRIVDKDGNFCPTESREIQFEVEGAGTFRASANGDPTCVYLFHEPKMPLFSGQLTALVQAATKSGKITFTAKADGVGSASITIKAK
ncbi:MAG: DUF4982 domain-containing protein [Bacteroidales bacterium]|nr:DUF4982 domain-containing protein [Bacteroidales bacterium]